MESRNEKPGLESSISTQPASSSHPPLQQSQGQRLSRGRGIYRNALWLCPVLFQIHLLKQDLKPWILTNTVQQEIDFEISHPGIVLLVAFLQPLKTQFVIF